MGLRIIILMIGAFTLIMGLRAFNLGHTPSNGYWDAPLFTAAGILVLLAGILEDFSKYKNRQTNNKIETKPETPIRTFPQIMQVEKVRVVEKQNKSIKPVIYHLVLFIAAICAILSFLRTCS